MSAAGPAFDVGFDVGLEIGGVRAVPRHSKALFLQHQARVRRAVGGEPDEAAFRDFQIGLREAGVPLLDVQERVRIRRSRKARRR